MSETSEPASSSSETSTEGVLDKSDEFLEPDCKKRKLSQKKDAKKFELEDRLGGILCCAVCLDLPKTAVYQVSFAYFFLLRILLIT